MRKQDREVKDIEEIKKILDRCQVLRIALQDGESPYIVPVSYGFEIEEGKVSFYFHGAKEGKKHELLEKNPRVGVETDILNGYVEHGEGRITADYESFIGSGAAEIVKGEEAVKGINLLMSHCGIGEKPLSKGALAAVRVYKIEIESFTAKRRFKKV